MLAVDMDHPGRAADLDRSLLGTQAGHRGAAGNNETYAARHPRPRDVVLLVEVSDTTYHRDRGRKWRRYAAAGIPVYMIVRLKGPDTLIEVWTVPTGRGRSARYTDVVRYNARAGESVPIELDGTEHGQVAVVDLIARQA